MSAGDLFGFEAPVEWNDAGNAGVTRDGRTIRIEPSAFISARYIAIIPVHGRDVVTRRSCASMEEARTAAEKAVQEWRG